MSKVRRAGGCFEAAIDRFTPDPGLEGQMLYPTELRARVRPSLILDYRVAVPTTIAAR